MIKRIIPWLFITFLSALLIIGFAMKDSMNNYLSKMMVAQAGSDAGKSGSAYVDSLFNYSENGLNFRVTFLEFGARGCSACKRMEGVMAEIKEKFPRDANVVFIDISKQGNQHLMMYFGIASIPTQVLLNKSGMEFFRHMGYYSAKELSEKLTSD